MNWILRPRAVATFVRFRMVLDRMRGALCSASLDTLRLATTANGIVISHLGQRVDCHESYACKLNERAERFFSALRIFKDTAETRNSAGTVLGIVKLGFAVLAFLLSTVRLVVQITISCCGAYVCKAIESIIAAVLEITRSEVYAHIGRTRALSDIAAIPSTPIRNAELVLWALTRARHTEEILGDFRESYENRIRRYGQDAALSWAHEQMVRELKSRVETSVRVVGWVRAIGHYLLRHRP